jgi:tetratricopeptide (TPR) repeat protein
MVVLKNLALLLISQQKVGDAIHLYERDLWGRVENLGIDHTDTMKAVCNLGNFLAKHGKFWDCFRLIMTYFTIHQRVGCLLLMSGIVALCLGYGYLMSYSFLYCGMYLVYWKLEGFNDILFQALVCAIIIGATVNVVTAYMSKGADVGLFVGDCVGALAGASLSIRIWFLGGGALSHKGAPIGVMIGSFVGYSIKSSVTAYIDSSALCAAVCLIYYFNEKLGFYRNTLRFGETILIFILFVLCFAVFTVCLQYYLFCNSVDFRVLWFLLGIMSQAKFGVLIAHFFTLAGILAVSISYTSVGCCFFLALPVAIMHFPGIDKRFNELLKDTPKGREKSPVFDSSIVLNEKLHNLNQLGMLDEAFALYESVLSGRENSVVDVRIMHSMTTLAILLEQHNKLEKAEIMYTHILGFREQRLGLSHPSTLIIANSLVILLYRQNRPEEALALHERALKGREKNIQIAYVDAVPSMNEREMSEAEMARRGCIALGTFTFGIVYLLLRFFYIDWVFGFWVFFVSYIYHVRLHVLIVHGFVIGGVTLCICYGSISSNFIFKLIFTAIAMFAVSFFWIAFFDIRLQQKCSKLFYGIMV